MTQHIGKTILGLLIVHLANERYQFVVLMVGEGNHRALTLVRDGHCLRRSHDLLQYRSAGARQFSFFACAPHRSANSAGAAAPRIVKKLRP